MCAGAAQHVSVPPSAATAVAPAPPAALDAACHRSLLNMSDCLPFVQPGSATARPHAGCWPGRWSLTPFASASFSPAPQTRTVRVVRHIHPQLPRARAPGVLPRRHTASQRMRSLVLQLWGTECAAWPRPRRPSPPALQVLRRSPRRRRRAARPTAATPPPATSSPSPRPWLLAT
ncbi:hypothetical protein ACQ4PT_026815 [Festuca glaucescens]